MWCGRDVLYEKNCLIPLICAAIAFTVSFDSCETRETYWGDYYNSLYAFEKKLEKIQELQNKIAELAEQGLIEEGKIYQTVIHKNNKKRPAQ